MDIRTFDFVVARNGDLDWRPLVAPPVPVENNEAFALVLATGASHPTPVTVTAWQDAAGSTWTLCFRTFAARTILVGAPGDEGLVDRFGRGIFLVEGGALAGDSAPSVETAIGR